MSEKDERERGIERGEKERVIYRNKVRERERMHLHREKECIYRERECI
jgi:hypothetical protein